MASQAFSASANVLKGDPPTLMAVLLKYGTPRSYKAGLPVESRATPTLIADYK
jgi:hypothetical protein